jgi:hypothetical protein
MKLIILQKLIFAVLLLSSFVTFSQSYAALYLSYGSPSVNVAYNTTVDYGQSTEIEFTIKNIPNQGNPSLTIQSITLSNSNFIITIRKSKIKSA